MMKIKMITFFSLFTILVGCEDSEYKKVMEPAMTKKLADLNSNPTIYGEEEPPILTLDEIKKDVKGIDRNQNGIRDDIDIWINRTGENYNEVMALRQKAKSLQVFLEVALEKKIVEAEPSMNKSIYAGYCMEVVFFSTPKYKKQEDLEKKLQDLHFYPSERTLTSVKFYKYVMKYGGGQYNKLEDQYKYCNFKVERPKELTIQFMNSLGIQQENIKWEE